MFDVATLQQLYRHMEWADAKVWRAALTHAGPVDARLRQLLVHVHLVQQAFLHVWLGRPPDSVFRKPEEFATLREVRDWGQPYYAEARDLLGSIDPSRLDQSVQLPWAGQLTEYLGYEPAAPTFGETAFQVANHSTYHRGQVNTRLRELNVEPPLVDYIAWVWFRRPEPEWGA